MKTEKSLSLKFSDNPLPFYPCHAEENKFIAIGSRVWNFPFQLTSLMMYLNFTFAEISGTNKGDILCFPHPSSGKQ
jgi:hypothetical protein